MPDVLTRNNLEIEERALLDELLLRGNLDDVIPQLARDVRAIARIEAVVRRRRRIQRPVLH